MHIDGKELARMALERRAKNMELKDADRDASNDQIKMGNHVMMMGNLVEAIHMKDHAAAHEHMEKIWQAMADKHMAKHLNKEEPEA